MHSFVKSKYDLILSDASPNRTGSSSTDSLQQNELALNIIEISKNVILPKGDLIIKYSRGPGKEEIEKWGKGRFESWKCRKPEGSRGESREGYVVGRGWKGGIDD